MSEEKKAALAYPLSSLIPKGTPGPVHQWPSILPPHLLHDGKLDDRYEVFLMNEGVSISNSCDDHVDLSPKAALSLLAWLRQQENELQHMAQEDEA